MATNVKKQKEAMEDMLDAPSRMCLSTKDVPELKDWKVGEKYDVKLHVKMTGLHEKMGGGMCGDFEIITKK